MALKKPILAPTTAPQLQPQVAAPPPAAVAPPPAPVPLAYKAAPTPTSLPQFDVLKNQASQRANAAGQMQTDALQRKFASMGNLQSGAAIKAQQVQNEAINQQKEDVIQGLDAAQMQEISRLGEVEKGREFQSSEAAYGRKMQQDVFDEQKKQNNISNMMALDEHELSRFNTLYNTALSYGSTPSAKRRSISAAWDMMFPKSSMQFNGSASGGALSRRQNNNITLAGINGAFGIKDFK